MGFAILSAQNPNIWGGGHSNPAKWGVKSPPPFSPFMFVVGGEMVGVNEWWVQEANVRESPPAILQKGKGMRGHKGGKPLTKGIEKGWGCKEKDQKQKRRKG